MFSVTSIQESGLRFFNDVTLPTLHETSYCKIKVTYLNINATMPFIFCIFCAGPALPDPTLLQVFSMTS